MQRVGDYEYSSGQLLGHGAFALVFAGRRMKDHQLVAVKQIKLKNVPGKLSNIKQKEIDILKDLRHPNIVGLFDYQETRSDVFLIMEYCNGGDLADYLKDKGTLSEDSIHILAKHIAGALEVLTAHQIIHRDIKPQNLLLSYPPGKAKKERSLRDVTIKLADFGFARHLSGTDMAATLCGSPLYMAPEILLGHRYDNKADLWSVGTILFQCLSGEAPFLAKNPHALRKKYERETLEPKVPPGTSAHLSQLLSGLLRKEPGARLSYESFFNHPFLSNSIPDPAPLLSQHVKSSPVPIQPHTQQPRTSHHRGSVCSLSPSSASGPPINHQIGSQGSPYHHTLHSPLSDITDQGFILVDLPHNSGSRRFVRSHSLSISPGGLHTPHIHSTPHTPSSLGSLSRYTSLTTPFYQTRPSTNHPLSTTPTNMDGSSGYHSHSQQGSLSRSNSGRQKLPFGQLIRQSSHSPHPHSLTNSPSPLSTPPSYQSSNQIRAGIRYAHQTPGSSGRLSSLAEEEGKRGRTKQGSQRGKKDSKSTNQYEISQSCVLVSDDEGDSPTDEGTFPLGLTMSFNSSQSVDDLEGQPEPGPHSFSEHAQYRRPSSTGHAQSSQAVITGTDRVGFKRSSSFTYRSTKLSQELADIHSRADSLYGEHPSPVGDINSGSPKIGSFQLPFLFPQTAEKIGLFSQCDTCDSIEVDRSEACDGVEACSGETSESVEVCPGLVRLRESLLLGCELKAMAQARQSPILLLSTSTNLSDSSVGGRAQRCCEQLVLYAKAVSVLESSLLEYEITMATRSSEPSRRHRNAEREVCQLLRECLERARVLKTQLSEYGINSSLSQVSAEKLLYSEALDMCKAAILDEMSGECIKRYQRAKLIFQHLLSLARSQKDKALLLKYMNISKHRVDFLSS